MSKKFLIIKDDGSDDYSTFYTKKVTTDSLKEAFVLRGVYQEILDRSNDILDKGRKAVVAQILDLDDLELVTKPEKGEEG